MSEWKEIELREVIETNKSSINRDYPYAEILYLDTGSITCNRISGLQSFSLAEAPSRAKRLVKNLDIIYSSVRPNQLHYGIIRNPENNLVVSTGFVVITCKEEEIAPYFLYHYLSQNTTTEFLHAVAEGSTSAYPSLKPSDLEALEILLPPIEEQRAIASVLSSLDDKIDLLHRQNKTLEQMAETLFRQWFVVEASEDWEVKKLGELVTVKRGGSPRPIQKYLSKTGLRWLKISDATKTASPFIFNIKEHIKIEGLKKTTLLKKGTLVLSNSATPGIPKILQVDSCIHDGWLHFPQSYFTKEFLYLLFKSIRPELLNLGNGSIFTNLKTDILKQYDIFVPKDENLNTFQNSVEPLFNKLLANTTEIRTLENLRDTLLPKLMSGEVLVTDVEKSFDSITHLQEH
ncbi:MAG: restriction endonuclease subunit S [Balneolales bacterium]